MAADLEVDVAKYREQGFLVLEGFAAPDDVAALKRRGEELVAGWEPAGAAGAGAPDTAGAKAKVSVFSTRNQAATADAYFMASASAIHFFAEEKAFDATGALRVPKDRAVNKIGHALHDLDPAFRRWTRSPRVAALLRALGYAAPAPVQSMQIFKQPGIGGEVVPHQDCTFLLTDPPSVVGLWLALEPATVRNGCLWAAPGSHAAGVRRRWERGAGGAMAFSGEAPAFGEADFVPLEVAAGTLVVLHGANWHMSRENSSDASRHAYSVHFAETRGAAWLPANWLQRPAGMPFEPLYDDGGHG